MTDSDAIDTELDNSLETNTKAELLNSIEQAIFWVEVAQEWAGKDGLNMEGYCQLQLALSHLEIAEIHAENTRSS